MSDYLRHTAGPVDEDGDQYCERCGELLSRPRERRYDIGQEVLSRSSGVAGLRYYRLQPHPSEADAIVTECVAEHCLQGALPPLPPFDLRRFLKNVLEGDDEEPDV